MLGKVNAFRFMRRDTRVKYREYLADWVQENGLFANYNKKSGFSAA